MDLNEKKELKSIVGEALKEVVVPKFEKVESRLGKIEEKLVDHDEKLDILIETVADVKVDVTEMKEDLNDMGYTTERIETRLNTVIKDQDEISLKTRQLNRRVLRLETKKS